MGQVLELAGVSKRYRRGPLVLDDVSFTLGSGALVQLRGGNGSGKSTLLRVACGFGRPTRGSVTRGFTTLGFVPDRAVPPARMTARTYLEQLGRLAGMRAPAITAAAEAFTDRLGLLPGLDAPLGELSRGNQRKVLLTQALMRRTDLLVLDEPFTALDAEAATALSDVLGERRREGCAILVALHGEQLGDTGHVLALEAGRVGEASAGRDGLRETRVVVELSGPQPSWPSAGEVLPDQRMRYLVAEPDVERLLAAALSAGARVLRVGGANPEPGDPR